MLKHRGDRGYFEFMLKKGASWRCSASGGVRVC